MIDEYEWDDPRTRPQKGTVGELVVVGKLEPPHDDGSQLLSVYCKETRDYICTVKKADFKQLIEDISHVIKRFSVE